jgi:hypothetical protein
MTHDQQSPADTIRLISQHQAALLASILTLYPERSEAQDILSVRNVDGTMRSSLKIDYPKHPAIPTGPTELSFQHKSI